MPTKLTDDDLESSIEQPVVLIIGFSDSCAKRINISQAVVEAIAVSGLDGIDLRYDILPSEYEALAHQSQNLFEKHRPTVTVYCGFQSMAEAVILEKRARNFCYEIPDERKKLPSSQYCDPTSSEKVLSSCFDLESIAREVKAPVPVHISRDAGLFLSEFVYFCSLNRSEKTLLLHVPMNKDGISLDNIVQTVRQIIKHLLQQCDCELNAE